MGIRDERVLTAVARLPRQLFVPPPLRRDAEADRPLPIGHGQTISQPYIVAYMTEALRLTGSERVLEVGTGSGYQTALLALLAREVHSLEIAPELAASARAVLLDQLALGNVYLHVGDGRGGWPAAAPFDRILVTAAPERLPEELLAQLAPGGRLVAPEGAEEQVLRIHTRGDDGTYTVKDLAPGSLRSAARPVSEGRGCGDGQRRT